MSESYLKAMNPKLANQTLSKCEACSKAKSTKAQVRNKAAEETKSKEVGENVASDLKEMYTTGTGGCKWMGSAIDTFSRYALIVAMRTKGEFSKNYTDIVTWYSTQTGKVFKKWTTDGGGEFNNAGTTATNRENGIQHQLTPPYNSRKNPFAERFNRTIGEAVAAMLLTAGMTAVWWVEAVQYAVYIYNRTPHKGLLMKTPYEVFYKKPHHHVPIKVFGCLAHVHNQLHTKKEINKTKACCFIGIDASGRYKFVELATKNRFTSDAADFYELIYPLGEHRKMFSNNERGQLAMPDYAINQKEIIVLDNNSPKNTSKDPYKILSKEKENGVVPNNSSIDSTSGFSPVVQEPWDAQKEAELEEKHATSGDTEEFQEEEQISNEETTRRYPIRNRHPSHAGLESIANTPPNHTNQKGIGRLNHRDIEALANAILYDKPIPTSYHQAVLSPDWPKWEIAIKKEVKALVEKETFEEVTTLPHNKRALSCKWVFKVKPKTEHEPETYKARLVVQGFRQREGSDFGETFAAVARTNSLRILIALAAANKTRMTKLDVANAFLSSKMDVELYVHTPAGYPSTAPFLKLLRALYGLKQAPRLWYGTLMKELVNLGFQVTPTDSCVLMHKEKECMMVIVVDDIIVCTNDEKLRSTIEVTLDKKFKIKAFGDVKSYVGLELEYTKDVIILRQKAYILKLLERFGMLNCKPATTPASVSQPQDKNLDNPAPPGTPYRELVGSLLYLFATRPDICVAVIKLSMHLESPTVGNWMQAKRVLRYLAGTIDKGIEYPRNISNLHLWAHTDSDWAGCKRTRRSTSGYVIFLDKGPICWKSKMQAIVALSSCEAEYIALVECIKEILWLLQHFRILGVKLELPVVIGIDNQAAIALAKNPVLHEKSKHIDTRHHFIRQAVQEGLIRLQYINTGDNIADILTKSTTSNTFQTHAGKLLSQN